MKPIIIKNSKIPKLLSWFINIRAITLFPFIIIKDEGDETLIRHESIHIQQQLELLVVGFYLWYVIDFIIKYFKTLDTSLAYYNIIFEQEAYDNQHDEDYLSKRRLWEFLRDER